MHRIPKILQFIKPNAQSRYTVEKERDSREERFKSASKNTPTNVSLKTKYSAAHVSHRNQNNDEVKQLANMLRQCRKELEWQVSIT
jgi:hypothetical protein